MPSLPTPPWAMEEPPLPAPSEILVIGGDAPNSAVGATEAEQPSAELEAPSLTGPDEASAPSTEGGGATPEPGAPAGHGPRPGDTRAGDAPGAGGRPVGEAVAPVLDPSWDDAFPILAALDAIRAAFAEDPPGLDQAARAELAALLGLDPALAAEEAAFMDALRDAPAPDGDALLAEWLSAARAAEPGVAPAPAADWPFP